MQLIKTVNPENVSESEAASFKIRRTARAIVYDQDGNIGLLHVSKRTHHKLPGGGVEEGEDIQRALKRECLEELGCEIEVFGEVGEIIEYRKKLSLKQISDCYVAKVVDQKGNPAFTQKELDDALQILWVPLARAIEILATDKTDDYEGQFILVREKAFLEAI